MKPIETRYAGCRFRSRLEARWACFFDELGIAWKYEPQGYEIPRPDGSTLRYLPDFWLPDMDLWAEVKGELTHEGLTDLILSVSAVGLPMREQAALQPRMLLLGDIPRADADRWCHTRLDLFGDVVLATRVTFVRQRIGGWAMRGCGESGPLNQFLVAPSSGLDRESLVAGASYPWLSVNPQVVEAYRAASTARFEHGETRRR